MVTLLSTLQPAKGTVHVTLQPDAVEQHVALQQICSSSTALIPNHHCVLLCSFPAAHRLWGMCDQVLHAGVKWEPFSTAPLFTELYRAGSSRSLFLLILQASTKPGVGRRGRIMTRAKKGMLHFSHKLKKH